MSENITLLCGCVVKRGSPLSQPLAISRCEVGEYLWQRWCSRHLDLIHAYGMSDTIICGREAEREHVWQRYLAHMTPPEVTLCKALKEQGKLAKIEGRLGRIQKAVRAVSKILVEVWSIIKKILAQWDVAWAEATEKNAVGHIALKNGESEK